VQKSPVLGIVAAGAEHHERNRGDRGRVEPHRPPLLVHPTPIEIAAVLYDSPMTWDLERV
jgi:hypothetical protein